MVFDKIAEIIAEKLDINVNDITPNSYFTDMDVDSLYMVEIMLSIEDEFSITLEDIEDLQTVGELCEYVESVM